MKQDDPARTDAEIAQMPAEEVPTTITDKPTSFAAARAAKISAMSRMRDSVKLTLFKGIPKKINPESSQDPEPLQGEFSTPKPFERKEEVTMQEERQKEDNFQIHSEMRNSVDMTDQKDKLESTALHKQRYNSLWNVIIDERDQKTTLSPSQQSSSPERPAINNSTRIFEENYELMGDKLGEGCHGEVRKCIHKITKKVYAVKMIRNGDTEIILSSITSFKIAKNLNHPAVIKPKELFINRETEKIYYVMEFCEYGSLQEYIENALNMSPRKRDKNRPRPPSIEFNEDEGEEGEKVKKTKKHAKKRNSNGHCASGCSTAKHNSNTRKRKSKRTDKPFLLKELVMKQEENTEDIKGNEELEDDKSGQWETQVEEEMKDDDNTTAERIQKLEQNDLPQPEFQNKNEPLEKPKSSEKIQGMIDSETAKRILKEILLAVSYLHSEGVCHRDLKPDNILISSDSNKIKIIDFEISKQFKYFRPNHQVLKVCEMWTRTGTQDYMAPEMFESTGYSESVDIWAIGVIAYLLLTGRLPFDQEYISDKVEAIRNCSYNTDNLKNVEEVPKDFIRRMLRKEPADRLTAVEALSHPWFLVNINISEHIASRYAKRKQSAKNNSSHSPTPKNSPEHQQLTFIVKGNMSTILFKPPEQSSQAELILQQQQCKSQKIINKQNINEMNGGGNTSTNYQKRSPYSYSTKGRKENTICNCDNLDAGKDGIMTENPKGNSCFCNNQGTNSSNKGNFNDRNENNKTANEIPPFCPMDSQSEIDLEMSRPLLLEECSSADRRNKQLFPGDQPLILQYQQSQQQVSSNNSINIQPSSNSNSKIGRGKNTKQSQRKEEFKKSLLDFKQQMSEGMTDISSAKFIHINQKQRSHPQASQLRLKLLQQKRDCNFQQQNQTQLLSQAKELQSIPSAVSTNIIQAVSENPTNTSFNNIQPFQGNLISLLPMSPLATAQISSSANNSFGSNSSLQAAANSNNNNHSQTSNMLISDGSKAAAAVTEPNQLLEGLDQDDDKQLQSKQPLSSQSSMLRSRSNTNDVNDHSFDSEEMNDERRAKRLSEDFTSFCEIQIAPIERQCTTPTSSQQSQTIGKVTKSSQFSNLRFARKTSSIQNSTEEIQLSSSSSLSPSAIFQKQFQRIQQQSPMTGKDDKRITKPKKLTIFNFFEGNQESQDCVNEDIKEEECWNEEFSQFQTTATTKTGEDQDKDDEEFKIIKQRPYGFSSQFGNFLDENEIDQQFSLKPSPSE